MKAKVLHLTKATRDFGHETGGLGRKSKAIETCLSKLSVGMNGAFQAIFAREKAQLHDDSFSLG